MPKNNPKEITPEEKIEKFLKWLKSESKSANDISSCSASSLNFGRAEAFDEAYAKAKRIFSQPKKKENGN